MNEQNGSTGCLESCAARLDLVSNIARKMIECEFPWFDHCDPLVVERTFSEVRVFYVCTKTSDFDHRTFVDCRFHFDSHQMWIGSIQVAARHRLQGIGRQLVKAVEATATALGMEEIKILPTPSSVDFWLKLDYAPDPRSARVLRKNPAAKQITDPEKTIDSMAADMERFSDDYSLVPLLDDDGCNLFLRGDPHKTPPSSCQHRLTGVFTVRRTKNNS